MQMCYTEDASARVENAITVSRMAPPEISYMVDDEFLRRLPQHTEREDTDYSAPAVYQ